MNVVLGVLLGLEQKKEFAYTRNMEIDLTGKTATNMEIDHTVVYEIPEYLQESEIIMSNMKTKKVESNIPKLLFQTAKSSSVGMGLLQNYKYNANLNSNFTRRFFDDSAARLYISEKYDSASGVLKAFDSLKVGAYKADIFRLCVLYSEGGFYKDINKVLLVPLDYFVSLGVDLVLFRDINKTYIYQALIGADKNNIHIKNVLDGIVKDVLAQKIGRDNLCPTGPGGFGKHLATSLKLPPKSEFPLGMYTDYMGGTIYFGELVDRKLQNAEHEIIQLARYDGWEKVEKGHYSDVWPDIYHPETISKNE
jgi:hypothetical protein